MATFQKLRPEIIQAAPTELLDDLGAGISIVDRNMRIYWVNKVLAKWFGALEKIKGKHCFSIYQHRNRVCPGCPTAQVLKDGKRHSAYQGGFNQKGEKRYYHLIVTPILNGNKKASYAMELTYDITHEIEKRKQKFIFVNKMKRLCSQLLHTNKKLKEEIHKLRQKNSLTFFLTKKLAQKYHEVKNDFKITKEGIKDIQLLDRKIIASADLKSILDSVVKLSAQLTHADAAALRMINQETKTLFIIASTGLSKKFIESANLKINQGVAGLAVATQKPIAVNDCENDSRVALQELLKSEGVKSYICVPAILNDEPLGTISLFYKKTKEISEQEMELLATFADQVAIAINEAKLYREVHTNYFNTVHSLSKAMEAKDPYTRGHSERVTLLALKVAQELKLSDSEIELLDYAGRIHDIGKIGISDTILNKPGRLTLAERALIEQHPQKGVEMLAPLGFLQPVLPLILHHHERFDGSGYPHHLKKQQIPLGARILTCTDSFDAMTSNRPYRYRSLSTEEAIGELRLNSGKQFDPQIANTFIQILSSNS